MFVILNTSARGGVEPTISADAGKRRIIAGAISLVPVGPLPLVVDMVIAFVVPVSETPAILISIICSIIAIELSSIGNVDSLSTLILSHVGSGKLLSLDI